VYQRSRLERIVAFVAKPAMCESAKLVIYQRNELVECVLVASFCRLNQIGCRGAKRLLVIHALAGVALSI
jgi:hypothetical protein